MTRGPGPAAVPIPQRGMAVDGDSARTLHRHPDGADGSRPGRASKYNSLVPAEPEDDPAAAGNQLRRDGHGSTMGTDRQG